jgi:branched-chain amino acid transport system ATP-binding protein
MAMLKLCNVELHYGGIRALSDVSLEVNEGEIVGLLGSNGAGKSSTLAAISGLQPIASGEIWFQDERIDGQRADLIARRGIGYVPEGRNVFARMTVEENLRVGAHIAESEAEFERMKHHAYVLFPLIAQRCRQFAGTLSGGEQQMLAIARVLMMKPRLLLLDEPSLGLAPRIANQVFATIRLLGDRGTTILLVEQNASKALEVCNRAYVIEIGKVVLSGTREELTRNPAVMRAYFG